MKKLAILLSVLLIFTAGCSKNEAPREATPTEPTPTEELTLEDKIFDNVYAGTVTEITDTEITILMDKRISETFTLNDRAKEDIKDFSIEKDTRVIVKFVSPEDRTITAIEKIVVE